VELFHQSIKDALATLQANEGWVLGSCGASNFLHHHFNSDSMYLHIAIMILMLFYYFICSNLQISLFRKLGFNLFLDVMSFESAVVISRVCLEY
jgi:hypothetical protein